MCTIQHQVLQETLGDAQTALSPTITVYPTPCLLLVCPTQPLEIPAFFKLSLYPILSTLSLLPTILWTRSTERTLAFREPSLHMVRFRLMVFGTRQSSNILTWVSWRLILSHSLRLSFLYGLMEILRTADNHDE
jgi:hypothetical protein